MKGYETTDGGLAGANQPMISAAKKPSEIEVQMTQLNISIEEFHQVISAIENTVAPILRAEDPQGKRNGATPPSVLTPLAAKIREAIWAVRNGVSKLRSIRERLEI